MCVNWKVYCLKLNKTRGLKIRFVRLSITANPAVSPIPKLFWLLQTTSQCRSKSSGIATQTVNNVACCCIWVTLPTSFCVIRLAPPSLCTHLQLLLSLFLPPTFPDSLLGQIQLPDERNAWIIKLAYILNGDCRQLPFQSIVKYVSKNWYFAEGCY